MKTQPDGGRGLLIRILSLTNSVRPDKISTHHRQMWGEFISWLKKLTKFIFGLIITVLTRILIVLIKFLTVIIIMEMLITICRSIFS